jgi:FkbM family methyltransferase
VRGGILAALSNPPAAAAQAVPAPAAPGAAALPVQQPPPLPPQLPRGFVALLRGAGRRGLRAARPLAAPFLHRLQMRFRTAVNESDLAARTAGVDQALAALSERFDAETAAVRREVAGVGGTVAATREIAEANARRLDAIGAALAERSDATRREVAGVGGAVAATREVAAAAKDIATAAREVAEANARRLDAIERGVAAVPDIVQARTAPPRRAPIPLGGEVMAWTPDGYLLLPAEDPRLVAAMSEGGVLEHGTRSVLAALLPPGGTFLDVGAHVGTMTLPAARRVGERGRVFAVEPLPRLAALLRRNLALNDVSDRVSVSACAAGEAEGEGLLHLGEVLGHSSLLPLDEPAAAGTVAVPVRRVDDVVPAGTRVDAVKIDAEGVELQVWRGMGRVLAESPRLAAVLEFGPSHLARAGVSPEAWLGELEASGFASYTIDEATGACRPASASALAAAFSTNVLLLRPDAVSRHPDLVFA